MNKIIVITLLTTLHIQPVRNGVVFVDFLLNKDYIRTFFCSNNKKPQLACNGKCYLMKELKKVQDKNEQEFPNLLNTKYEFVFTTEKRYSIKNVAFFYNNKQAKYKKQSYTYQFIDEIFHPPTTLIE